MTATLAPAPLPLATADRYASQIGQIEARLEPDLAIRKVWLAVRDWSVGAAVQHKLNLDSGPVAFKAQTGSAGPESGKGRR